MGLELRLGALPIIVPDSALDALTSALERKARDELVKVIPSDPIMRQAVKALCIVALPRMRAAIGLHVPGYPLPQPPRHGDLVAYLVDYLCGFALYGIGRLRADVCAQPWEVSVVEVGTGLQVAGLAALDTSDPRADYAAGDGARSGDAASVAGTATPAA